MNPIIERMRLELKLEQIWFRKSREANAPDLMRHYEAEERLLQNQYISLTGHEFENPADRYNQKMKEGIKKHATAKEL